MRIMAPYRVVILKRAFSATSRKTIVRKSLISTVLTIIDSDVLKGGSENQFFMRSHSHHHWIGHWEVSHDPMNQCRKVCHR